MEDGSFSKIIADDSTYAGKTLSERLTGRFYTPDRLAKPLADQLVDALTNLNTLSDQRSISICDPFCGDGRLVLALLEALSSSRECRTRSFTIGLRDIDAAACNVAAKRVRELSRKLCLKVVLTAEVGDSFTAAIHKPYDIVITNPPWEILKPDLREISHLSEAQRTLYKQELQKLSAFLDKRFPAARAEKAWAGWGTSLARCGWAFSLDACRKGGVVGIVLPASLLSDQSSVPMRKAVLEASHPLRISVYPAEARLFTRVDQPVATAVFAVGVEKPRPTKLYYFDNDCRLLEGRAIQISRSKLEAAGLAIPMRGGGIAFELAAKLIELPKLRDLEGGEADSLWLGRELDETRIFEKTTSGGRFPFIKGRMVRRHSVTVPPSHSVRTELAQNLRSINFERVVWRDVSRPTQARRMIGTVIPKKWVAGNSLHVGYFRDGDVSKLRALHAILSSLVLEFQVRCSLGTNHMSLGAVRNAHIPVFSRSCIEKLETAANIALQCGEDTQLEVVVARAYGLSRDDMAQVVEQFPGVSAAQREAILQQSSWSSKFHQ